MDVYGEIREFYRQYRGEKRVIGTSLLGRDVFAMRIGKGKPCGISQYGIHGREYLCAFLALEHIRRGLSNGSVWLVPLADPDGAMISSQGITSVPPKQRKIIESIGGNLALWKANARGVDINVNFDARWGTGASNVRYPASANYIGPKPFSEPETAALRDFTLEISPDFTLSWHTKGEVIYWRFHQPVLRAVRDKRIANVLSRATGYPLGETKNSAGGYKDWCVEKLKIPAFTVEAGAEKFPHPLGEEALIDISEKCGEAIVRLVKEWR